MTFKGFQKLTLLDFPGRVACTLFTDGCNFRCPFCHNASLVTDIDDNEGFSDTEVLSYLKKRTGILDGVCITGGEPLLHPELTEFIKSVKDLGFKVKLDTNGSLPDRLKVLAGEGLLDYVAMDIKNSPEKYAETAGVTETSAVWESVDFLLEGNIDYEFRTTIVAEFHTVSDIEKIAKRIMGAKRYFLQGFVDSGNLIGENLHPHDYEIVKNMLQIARKYIKTAELRGI